MKLSLIVTYRNRVSHLQTLLTWWKQQARELRSHCEVLLVDVSATPSDSLQTSLKDSGWHYLHCPCPGIFHKTRALNLGLGVAQGTFIAPFDVDLIPVGETLTRHLWLAEQSPAFLVTGYRVMIQQDEIADGNPTALLETATIAPEDQPTALRKHLIQQERFGVVPLFERQRLLQIQGWDERFIGWGGEDQDILERYLGKTRSLCRCPDLVYLHLYHPPSPQWSEAQLTAQNRRHYYQQLQERQNLSSDSR